MVLNRYEFEEEWGDGWDDPKVDLSKFALTLRNAILERATVAGIYDIEEKIYRVTTSAPTVAEYMNELCSSLIEIIPSFYKLPTTQEELANYDFSDGIEFWTYEEIIKEPDCDISGEFESNQLFSKKDKNLFIAMYNVINKLRYVDIIEPSTIIHTASSSEHDYLFDESYQITLDEAKENFKQKYDTDIPKSVYAWNGNVDYEQRDYLGYGGYSTYYCGYIEYRAFILQRILNRLPGRICNVVLRTTLDVPSISRFSSYLDVDLTEEDKQLITPAFGYNIKTGLSMHPVAKDGRVNLRIGGEPDNKVPVYRNRIIPKSDYSNPTIKDYDDYSVMYPTEGGRKGSLSGYETRFILFLDYGIEGGYRYHSDEVIPLIN